EPQPFRAGVNRAGDRLWVEDIIWVWRVNIQNAGAQSYRFHSGSSEAGERLTSFGDPVIEEVFRDLKPAHTFCYFAYQENE
ncbi:TPA: YmfQ family protein, partial [Enterobacter hormaechei]